MSPADDPQGRRNSSTLKSNPPYPPGVPLELGPPAPLLAVATVEGEAHPIIGYRVRPSLLGPRLWALRLDAPEVLLRDLAWTPRRSLHNAAGDDLARAILIHWLDREPPIFLVERFRQRFFGRLSGPEFTLRASDVNSFLVALGVLR